MGVKGLWQVLEASGQPVTLESLEGKILAVDISIWLNQSLRGVRDKYGTAKADAHLQTLFSRICKLLYYRIRPIFVFDGRMPALKLETLSRRRNLREKATKKSDEIRSKLLKNLVKQQALHAVLSTQTAPQEEKSGLFEEQPAPNAAKPVRRGRRTAAAVAGSGRNIDVETDLFLIPEGNMPESSSLEEAMAEDAEAENDADYIADDRFSDSDDDESSDSDGDEITEIDYPLNNKSDASAKGIPKKTTYKPAKNLSGFKRRRIGTNMPMPTVAAELLASSSNRHAAAGKKVEASSNKRIDIDTVNFDAEDFKTLPSQVRHEILLDLDASRKNHSWAKMKYMPDDSNDFSGFQLGRMMKRQKVHKHLDDSIKEINARLTESIFSTHMPNPKSAVGRITSIQSKKLASEDSAHFLLVNLKASSSATASSVAAAVDSVVNGNDITVISDNADAVDTDQKATDSMEKSTLKTLNDTIEVSSGSDDDADEAETNKSRPSANAAPVSLADEYMDLLFEDTEPARHQPLTTNPARKSEKVSGDRRRIKTSDVKFVAPATPPLPRPANNVAGNDAASGKPNSAAYSAATTDSDASAGENFSSVTVDDAADKRKVIDLLGHCIELELNTPTDLRAALDRQRQEKQERRRLRYSRVEDVFASVITATTSTSITTQASVTSKISVSAPPKELISLASNGDASTVSRDKHRLLNRNVSITTTESSGATTGSTKSTTGDDEEVVNVSDNEDDVFVSKLLLEKTNAALSGREAETQPHKMAVTAGIADKVAQSVGPSESTLDNNDDKNDNDEGDDIDDAEFVDVIDADEEDVNAVNERNLSSGGSSPLVLEEVTNHRNIDLSTSPLPSTSKLGRIAEETVEDENRPEFVDELVGLENINFDEPAELTPSSSQMPETAVPGTQLRRFISSEEREKLNQLGAELSDEQLQLLRAAGREQRMATSVTDQIISDCIELLKLFGLPFVMAPSEAEAQCAYLDATNQTQGSITDDSDAWLFGARRIYKSFFNQRHKVEFYSAEACYKSVGLTRERMIAFAMLTGCDYTDGLAGVGSVAGMEILAEFADDAKNAAEREISAEVLKNANGDDAEKLLCSLARWYRNTRQRRENDAENRNKFRQKLKKLLETAPPSSNFPDRRVIDAFRRPLVDESRAPFSWTSPNLSGLRQFFRMRLGWSTAKVDEVLMPMVKRQLDEAVSGKQRRIDEYFARKPPAIVRVVKDVATMAGSKRLNKAISRVKSLKPEERENDDGVKFMESVHADDERSSKSLRRTASQQGSAASSGGGGFFEPTSSSQISQEFDGKQSFLKSISADDVCGVEQMLTAGRRRRKAVADDVRENAVDEDQTQKIADQLAHRRANKRALGIRDDEEDRNGDVMVHRNRPGPSKRQKAATTAVNNGN